MVNGVEVFMKYADNVKNYCVYTRNLEVFFVCFGFMCVKNDTFLLTYKGKYVLVHTQSQKVHPPKNNWWVPKKSKKSNILRSFPNVA